MSRPLLPYDGHGYFAVAGWGITFTSEEFLLLIADYLDPDTKEDPTDEEFEVAFVTFLNVKSPGLGAKIQLHYDVQSPSAETIFATSKDAAFDDARGAGGRSTMVPTGEPPEYTQLVEACGGAGKAGLTLYCYEGP